MLTNLWVSLSERGFWVFPVSNRQKYPGPLAGKNWDWFLEEKEHELLHAHLLNGAKATGAALCPQASDPLPLLILDLDVYGMSFDSVWAHVSPNEPAPNNTLIVESASGGWHLWFQLPPDVNADKLPATVDFGAGVVGELRVSSGARRLIMLPDSLATNKHGRASRYRIISGTLDDPLSLPPSAMMTRIVARKDQGKAEVEGNQPTEVMHFIKLLEELPEIEEGGRNQCVSQIGQMLGRMHPSKKLPEPLLDELWSVLSPKLGMFGTKEFRIAINSGWATGSKNAEKFQAREKHPSVTDVKSECEGLFGSIPWLVEVRDSAGKTKEWMAGFGGSAKRRNEADKIVRLRDLKDILPTLTRLTSASMDSVARSPLFIQPGWAKVLEYMLSTEKAVDQLGIPAEETFWELLEEWAKIAAGDLLFLEAWTEKRPFGAATAFIVWPLGDNKSASLIIPSVLQETMLTQIGDIPKAKRLVNKHLLKKTLVGMRSGQQVWACPLSVLEPITQEHLAAQYEQFVRKKSERQ